MTNVATFTAALRERGFAGPHDDPGIAEGMKHWYLANENGSDVIICLAHTNSTWNNDDFAFEGDFMVAHEQPTDQGVAWATVTLTPDALALAIVDAFIAHRP